MARKVKPPIERVGADFRINLEFEERDLIHRLMGEFRTLLHLPGDDSRLVRLFPTAYHQACDREMDEEYQRLMREELVASRLKGLELIEDFLATPDGGTPRLSEGQMAAFLQALNGVRLVLGTMLDVSEDHDIGEIGDDHPLAGEYQLYDFLSWLLDWTVRALQS